MKCLLIVALIATVAIGQQVDVSILPNPLVGRAGEFINITCTGPESFSLTLEVQNPSGTFTTLNTTGRRTDLQGETIFNIGPLTMDDNGVVYRCSFPSPTPSRANATLSVFFPPTLVLNGEQSRTVTEGEMVTITVDFTGNPVPMFSDFVFSFNSGMTSVTPIVSDGVVDITFPSINRNDDGMYTLFVNTSEGEDSVSFTLDVLFPPTFEEDFADVFICRETNGPFIRCAGMVGATDAALRCGVIGNPTPVVTREIMADETSNINETLFVFNSTVPQNSGTYTCNATNEVASIVRKFDLDIGSRPADVLSLMAVISEDRFSAVLTWEYDNNNNLVPVDYFIVDLFLGDTMISSFTPDPDLRTFNVPLAGLMTNQDYRVTIRATNLLGDSQMLAEAQFQTPNEIPTTAMPSTEGTTEGAISTTGSLLMCVTMIVLSTLLY